MELKSRKKQRLADYDYSQPGAYFVTVCIRDRRCILGSLAPTDARIENMVRTWKTLITKELGYSIWQRSYYDHVIRDEQSYVDIAEYITGDPGKWVDDKYYSP